MSLASQAAFESARRIVFKVGSALLVDAETGAANRAWLEAFCADAAALRS
ncbi:MAG TPA: glutamate 5-kinase, partial [Caulobacter sp.]|nr:glutamate 5-kinase [Caulobacter sp.]